MLVSTLLQRVQTGTAECLATSVTTGFPLTPAPSSAPSRGKHNSLVSTQRSEQQSNRDTENVNNYGNENKHFRAANRRESHTNAHFATNVSQHKNIDITHVKPPRVLKTIKISNELLEALTLPTICNLIPR